MGRPPRVRRPAAGRERDVRELGLPLARSPSRGWRRWGTQKLFDTAQQIALDYAARFPGSPRLVIGDLSRPKGGSFGSKYGGIGHGSHQNGLDVDIYYPRRDGL